jgi:hypothetical protein
VATSALLTGAGALSVVALFAAPASGQTGKDCRPANGSDDSRYEIVLAGRSGVFYDGSGPTFAVAIKSGSQGTTIDAVGIYKAGAAPAFGTVPEPVYREFMAEPRQASDVVLRLAITGPQYDRATRILKTWDRRAREKALLYPDIAMNNILFAKQVTESLNDCGETIALYALDWGVEDAISERNRPSNVPFLYFKELRRLNEGRHVRIGSTAGRE